jgi:NAD+ kinase
VGTLAERRKVPVGRSKPSWRAYLADPIIENMSLGFAIASKYDEKIIESKIRSFGFRIVQKNPDFAVCYGGDGTILYSERKFPSVPKIVLKKNSVRFRKYDYKLSQFEPILRKISAGNYKIIEEDKLEAITSGKRLIALNEVQVRAKLPTKALRFSVQVNGISIKNLVGDGVIVATPFGSTGYYSATGGKPFKKGIGVSFNNLFRQKVASNGFPSDSRLKVKVERGPAIVMHDNFEDFISIDTGSVVIRKAKEKARFVEV